jgi:hypothetical protein
LKKDSGEAAADARQSTGPSSTPGPWKAAWSVDGDFFGVYPDTSKMEFPIAVRPQFIREDVWEANAHLIASAPALLAELRYLVDWLYANRHGLGGDFSMDELLADPLAALDKAEGRS